MNKNQDKILLSVYDKIISGEIVRFDSLVQFVEEMKLDNDLRNLVFSRGYNLIKKLHWGIFAKLSYKEFPVLWKELIIAHPRFRTAGDIKRSMTISNVFISMMDIHGYTAFCQQSKKNLSKLHELDDFLNTTIQDVAKKNGCIGNRERGDEILLVGGSALDIMRTTFEIIQIFAKENFFKYRIDVDPSGEFNQILPKLEISAGVSGGNINTPMIITKKGEISGFLLNMAARLQARANKLSPKDTKVIIAKTVQKALEKEIQQAEKDSGFTSLLQFFDCGQIAVKGMTLNHADVIFRESDRYKFKIQELLNNLFASLKQNLWKEKVMLDLLQLVSATAHVMPHFSETVALSEHRTAVVDNEQVRKKAMIVRNLFTLQQDYITAIDKLTELVEIIQQISGFEKLVIEYAEEIARRYQIVTFGYQNELAKEIAEKKAQILTPQEAKVYDYFMKNKLALKKLEEKTRQSPAITQKRSLWFSQIEKSKSELDFSLYSGKK